MDLCYATLEASAEGISSGDKFSDGLVTFMNCPQITVLRNPNEPQDRVDGKYCRRKGFQSAEGFFRTGELCIKTGSFPTNKVSVT